MLWLYLLGAVTVLTIALRRVLRRQQPLSDELYSKQVAIDHVHNGVAWVRRDGKIGSVNPALVAVTGRVPKELVGIDWLEMFAESDRDRVREGYSQMLLGKTTMEARLRRSDGGAIVTKVLLVAIHDHKSRLLGDHCLFHDSARELELEQQVAELKSALEHATQTTAVR